MRSRQPVVEPEYHGPALWLAIGMGWVRWYEMAVAQGTGHRVRPSRDEGMGWMLGCGMWDWDVGCVDGD